jgi:type VI secretion system Hcp family effector
MSNQTSATPRWNLVLTLVLVLALAVIWMTTVGGVGANAASTPPVVAQTAGQDALEVWGDYVGSGGHIYARYEGVDGEASEAEHVNWIELLGVGWSARAADVVANPAARASAATVDGFAMTFAYDKAAPKLAEKLLKGEVIPKLEVEFTQPADTAQTYLRYEMQNVRIVDYSMRGKTDGGRPVVEFVTEFEKIKATYTQFAENGTVESTTEYEYDVHR